MSFASKGFAYCSESSGGLDKSDTIEIGVQSLEYLSFYGVGDNGPNSVTYIDIDVYRVSTQFFCTKDHGENGTSQSQGSQSRALAAEAGSL